MEELGTLAEQYHKQWGNMFIEGCPCCFIEEDVMLSVLQEALIDGHGSWDWHTRFAATFVEDAVMAQAALYQSFIVMNVATALNMWDEVRQAHI
jgi:hypothetical protein